MDEIRDMDYKIDFFKTMDGWDKMCDALTDIDPDKREATLHKFINFVCGMII